MASFSLHGDLPNSLENALTATALDDRIDLSRDGIYFIGQDEAEVSYFAEVTNPKVTEFFCKDASGARVPSFMLTGHKGPEMVCYLCWTTPEGQKFSCTPIPCKWV